MFHVPTHDTMRGCALPSRGYLLRNHPAHGEYRGERSRPSPIHSSRGGTNQPKRHGAPLCRTHSHLFLKIAESQESRTDARKQVPECRATAKHRYTYQRASVANFPVRSLVTVNSAPSNFAQGMSQYRNCRVFACFARMC